MFYVACYIIDLTGGIPGDMEELPMVDSRMDNKWLGV